MQELVSSLLNDFDLEEISQKSGVSGGVLKQIRDNPSFDASHTTLATLIATLGEMKCIQEDS